MPNVHAPPAPGKSPNRINPLAIARWQQLGRELATNKDIELDIETAAPLFATFDQLRRQGHPFDPTLIEIMAVLKRQGFTNDGESDFDEDLGSYYAVLPKSQRDRYESLRTNAAKEDLKFSLTSQGGVA